MAEAEGDDSGVGGEAGPLETEVRLFTNDRALIACGLGAEIVPFLDNWIEVQLIGGRFGRLLVSSLAKNTMKFKEKIPFPLTKREVVITSVRDAASCTGGKRGNNTVFRFVILQESVIFYTSMVCLIAQSSEIATKCHFSVDLTCSGRRTLRFLPWRRLSIRVFQGSPSI